MSEGDTEVLEAQSEQRAASKRATFELLRDKKPVEREFAIKLPGQDEPITFLFRSIGSAEYEKLVTKSPPTLEQKAEGGTYDPDRFAPQLLARVCIDPVLGESQWREIWNSADWSRGETGDLFFAAVQLCSRGLELDPTAAG